MRDIFIIVFIVVVGLLVLSMVGIGWYFIIHAFLVGVFGMRVCIIGALLCAFGLIMIKEEK